MFHDSSFRSDLDRNAGLATIGVALRGPSHLSTQTWSQAKNPAWDCARHSPTQPGSRLAPPRILATSCRQLVLGFFAAGRTTLAIKFFVKCEPLWTICCVA